MLRDELASWLRLSLTPGIGNTAARKLFAAFGLPGHIFSRSSDALRQVVTDAQAAALLKEPPGLGALFERTVKWLHDNEADGVVRRIVTLGDEDYPASLLESADPPLMLHLMGSAGFDLNRLDPAIAIVGSRNPTAQGAQNAHAFSRAFAEAGLTIVSGLALGIDGAAHAGALAAATPGRAGTVAVVGTGLDRVYPARHRELAHRIALQGLIVSEYPLGTPPLTQHFPQRNRIISGLTRGTLVVEAALRSGSLITARLAAEQGREVFAIPGSIHSPQARGCHALIRQGAKLVESVGDVLEELRIGSTPAAASRALDEATEATEAIDPFEPALMQALGFDPVSLDALCARTGMGPAILQAHLLELELSGSIARMPGGLFQRVAAG